MIEFEYGTGNTLDDVFELAGEAKERSHTPYDEQPEGAVALAREPGSDRYVAVPGAVIENGNYTNTRSAAETAVLNALNQGYDTFEHLIVTREEPRERPLQFTTQAVTSEFLGGDTPITVDDGDITTYLHDDLNKAITTPETGAYAVEIPDDRLDESADTTAQLVEHARDNMTDAYVPVSGYNVGGAVLDADGFVHPGNNIENTEKRAVAHGEETALLHWATFTEANVESLVAASRDGGNCCGYCKQWMAEFLEDDAPVINASSDAVVEHTYGEIDPFPFRLDLDA